jgi:hypothetical protein
MSFPPEKPFNPPVSKIPVLGPSSGNPKAFRDPNSTASIGKNIQAMTDQAGADTLYDAPMKKEGFSQEPLEGFRNELYSPWILRSQACRKEVNQQKEGFENMVTQSTGAVLIVLGLMAITAGIFSRR